MSGDFVPISIKREEIIVNTKYFKNVFIITIVILIIVGIYVVYIKNNIKQNSVQVQNKEIVISKEIIIGITNFDTINPVLTKNLEIQHITKLIYEPLINITQDFNTKPEIAEECSKINDLTYLIKLDENKRWSNGKPVTVEDVEYTIKSIRDSDSIYKENVKQIENIEKVNEDTFKVHLREPVDFFEYLLCFPIIKENPQNPNIPMHTGKYQITNINENQIIIEGEEQTIIIKILKNTTELYNDFTRKNVDLIITGNTNYEKYIGNIGFEEKKIIGREFYYISCENIDNTETRKTLNSNINKEKLVYDLYNRKYIVVNFPLEYGSYLNKEKTIKNVETTSNQETFTLFTKSENIEIAKKIKEQLEEKNIKIKIQNYQNTKADLLLKKEIVPITPEIRQYFKNEQTKERIRKTVLIENKEILKEEYNKIIDDYYNEIPFISLYFNTYIILHTNTLKGDFSGNWYNMFYNINTWYKIIWIL